MKKNPYPNYSTDNSEDVLKKLLGDKLIHENFYGPQMEKRQRCFDIAGELKCDFGITMDSDDYIHPDYTDFTKFKRQLECAAKCWDEEELFHQLVWIPDEKLYPRQHNTGIPDNSWKKYVRIHHDPGNMHYVKNHFTWAKKEFTEDDINQWNWNPDNWQIDEDTRQKVPKMANPYILQANMTIDGIRITTDRIYRSPDSLKFGDGWAWQNMHYETFVYDILPAGEARGMKDPGEGLEYFFDEHGKRRFYNKNGRVMSDDEQEEFIARKQKALELPKI